MKASFVVGQQVVQNPALTVIAYIVHRYIRIQGTRVYCKPVVAALRGHRRPLSLPGLNSKKTTTLFSLIPYIPHSLSTYSAKQLSQNALVIAASLKLSEQLQLYNMLMTSFASYNAMFDPRIFPVFLFHTWPNPSAMPDSNTIANISA